MNKQTFIALIKDPYSITAQEAEELEKVVLGFPYCQTAYILLAKQASDSGSMFADQKIKKAAAYTLDRKNLKTLLSSKKLKEIHSEPTLKTQENKAVIPPKFIPEPALPLKPISGKSTSGLSDSERNKIIEELQENLKRLHDRKLKAAWNISTEELEANGEIISSEPSIKLEEFSPNENVRIEKDPILLSDYFTQSLPKNSFVTFSLFPIRAEDVIIEEEEKKGKEELLLDYLIFLDEKRGIFRKNKKKEEGIIDKFILKDPKIPKLDINNLPDNSVDLSSKSSSNTKQPISENFAKILSLQGKIDKAILIYEQLILKIPEKKAYFEAQIEKLKNKL